MAATCNLTGTLVRLDGTPMRFAAVKAVLSTVPGYGGVLFTAETSPGQGSVICYSNGTGAFTLTLAQGICVDVWLPGADEYSSMVVPALSTARLADHIYPHAASVEWASLAVDADDVVTYPDLVITPSPDRVELAGGATVNICLRITWSNALKTAYVVSTLSAAPNPGYSEISEQALAITQAGAGDVVVSHSLASTLNADDSSLPVLLLPTTDYDITTPGDLLIRFT